MEFETKNSAVSMPVLGETAPSFNAVTTMGEINFPQDYLGRWVVLFSHPSDFTPVCTSEIATFAAMQEEFARLNTTLIGLSVDSATSHLAWVKEIRDSVTYGMYVGQEINFPIVADLNAEIARKYGMIHPQMNNTKTVRAVFVIDPEGIIRTILYYPQTTGRNFEEIKRVVEALQLTDKYGVSTPADWHPGKDILLAAPSDMHGVDSRLHNPDKKYCQNWFFCLDEGKKYPMQN